MSNKLFILELVLDFDFVGDRIQVQYRCYEKSYIHYNLNVLS